MTIWETRGPADAVLAGDGLRAGVRRLPAARPRLADGDADRLRPTLLTDVSALPRVARLGIMQDVFRWSVVVHTRIVPPTGCRPLRRCRAEASARTCCRGRVLGQHCCPDPDPAAYRPATRAVLASSCAPDSRGLPHAVGRTRTSGRPRRALPAKCFLVWVLLVCRVARREPAGPTAPHQAVGQMTIHDNTAVDCR